MADIIDATDTSVISDVVSDSPESVAPISELEVIPQLVKVV
jgi:hypothetical protein